MSMRERLVRDKVPNHITHRGGAVTMRVARESEKDALFENALREATNAFFEKKDADVLLDIVELCFAVGSRLKFDQEKLLHRVANRRQLDGTYYTGTLLITNDSETDSL